MYTDTLQLLAGSVFKNVTIESGSSLPTTASSTVGRLFWLTTAPIGLYYYDGGNWNLFSSVSKTSQLTNDSGFITGASPSLTTPTMTTPTVTGRTQSDAYSHTVIALGSVSGTQTLDLAAASEWTLTVTAATTFAFTNTLAAGKSEVVFLRITNGGSATITWPASTKFAAATAPTLSSSGTDLLGVKYDTTTSTYMVFVVGLAIA